MSIRLLIDISDNAMTFNDIARGVEHQLLVRITGAPHSDPTHMTIAGVITGRVVGAQQVHNG